jgi:hypothetical protein
MRSLRIEWGKFKLELPGEVLVFLLLKTLSLLLFTMNV